ncbi:hypothetical protein HPK19_25235 (plasmid) [Arthrobacter citreus]|nr:hypothetical protein HPK19_25235 [Arthrobacter citreus]
MGNCKCSESSMEMGRALKNKCSGDTVTLRWIPISDSFIDVFQSNIVASGACFPQGVMSFVEVNRCLFNKGFRIVDYNVVNPGSLTIIYVKC